MSHTSSNEHYPLQSNSHEYRRHRNGLGTWVICCFKLKVVKNHTFIVKLAQLPC